MHLSFIPNKKSEWDTAHFEVSDNFGTVNYKIHKRYANDDTAQYARWMVTADLGMGFSDMGDSYVTDVVICPKLERVAGEEPTQEQRVEYQAFREKVMGR